jgi:hypothetical protein
MVGLRPKPRCQRCLSFKIEVGGRDERVKRTLCAEDSFQRKGSEWFRILDWFEKVTKSGLGIQGT